MEKRFCVKRCGRLTAWPSGHIIRREVSNEPPAADDRSAVNRLPGGAYLSALLIALALLCLVILARPRQPAVQMAAAPTAVPSPGPVTVYVTGEVRRPGTYTLPPGSRVEHAIERAGGMTARADPMAINLAQRLRDEMQFSVPARGQVKGTEPFGETRHATPSITARINVNTATAEELDALPGIGPSKAAAIVEYREQHGPFRRAAGLQTQ